MISEAVTRQRAGTTTDRYGNTVLDWTNPDEDAIDGCAFAPTSTSEDYDQRAAVIQVPMLYAPPGADINAADRIVFRGTTFEVNGEPATWVDPFSGVEKGIEVPLRVVAG